MNLNSITSVIADSLAERFPSLLVSAEVGPSREETVGAVPAVVVLSGPSSEVGAATYTYKARIEVVLYYQPDAVEDYDPDTPDLIAAAMDSLLDSWTLANLPSLPVYLYDAKRHPTVAKKAPLQYEYHIPYTLFLQF